MFIYLRRLNVMSPRHCGALDRSFNGVGAVDIHGLFALIFDSV
jgi:hypothetical protein